jgi:hypothetical protein
MTRAIATMIHATVIVMMSGVSLDIDGTRATVRTIDPTTLPKMFGVVMTASPTLMTMMDDISGGGRVPTATNLQIPSRATATTHAGRSGIAIRETTIRATCSCKISTCRADLSGKSSTMPASASTP